MNQQFLRKALIPLGAIVLFLLVNVVFFSPQLSGKKLRMGDIESWKAMSHEADQYLAETGKTTLWTNSIFGGMPTYQITARQKANVLRHINKALRLWIPSPIGNFFLAMVGFYIMFLVLKIGHIEAIIGALCFGLCTNSLVLFETGHTSKMMAVAYMPLIIAGVVLTFQKKYLLGGAIFAMGTGLNVLVNHPQMTYYFLLVLGIFGIVQLVHHIREKDLPSFGKAAGVLLIGLALALGSSSSKLLTTYEYSRDTMRGQPVLKSVSSTEAATSSETEGLAWNYAMEWSNGVSDLGASIVPRAVGGSNSELLEGSKAISALRKKAANLPQNFPVPLYHGALRSTSGPVYFGAVICFLFVLAFFLTTGTMRWWVGLGALFIFLISLGRNFAGFNELLYENLPFMNKFRAPSSATSINSVLFPFFAVIGLSALVTSKVSAEKKVKSVYMAAGVTAGLSLLMILVGPMFMDFVGSFDPNLAQQGWDVNLLKQDRKSALTMDALRSIGLILLAAGLAWAWLKNKISKNVALIGIGLLAFLDIWMIGKRYLNSDDFVEQKQAETAFTPRDVDNQILNDPDLYYRVHDLTQDPWNSAKASYFHKTIGGYHAAKLQRYQDMIDRYLSKGDKVILDMLNMKYIITADQQNRPVVQTNPGALGNAWFVETIKIANTNEDEIGGLATFDPRATAFVHADFKEFVDGFDPVKDGSIELTSYAPDRLTYKSNSRSDQLAIFSDIWYGPNKGWKAFLDGQPVDHFRANYILRAMNVPAGEHDIEFVFDPKTYKTGEMLSLLFSLLIVGWLVFAGYKAYNNLPVKTEKDLKNKVGHTQGKREDKKVKRTVSKNQGKNRKK